ncbi:TlyA family RNA methyltransferase [Ferrimicrobium sp.]|uniref:TlyA family RNA methyltransferase n=1 Tax=Ferrimicrobium sp. TaxID=2926050 RepID=UPI002609D15D|nr:TlyA family RNA methyltransferase [Ferrimicrobium sp.]
MTTRQRLDLVLQRRGMARSRAQADLLIGDGLILVNGSLATKGSRLVAPMDAIEVLGSSAWHPRGYDKLHGALQDLGVSVVDKTCLDVGASTGGFVKALLDGGAASVVAVDVGTAQLDATLRADARVSVYEQTDIRTFSWPSATPPDLVSVDVSFVSIQKIADALRSLSGPTTELLLLIKPQFEVDRQIASRFKGVIKDLGIHEEVLTRTLLGLSERGLFCTQLVPSRRKGSKGNQEYFAYAAAQGPQPSPTAKDLITAVLTRN